ncbi:hypothetical protein RQP46_004465 [Phenoliferia psychrophenolica]
MGQAGSSSSGPDVEVDQGEISFFAQRDSPVQFGEGLISHLSSNSLPSSSSNSAAAPSAARSDALDQHVQSRITAELTRLHEQEASVKDEIERALEKENLDREAGADDGQPGVSHSATLMKDLEELETRTVALRQDILRNKESAVWGAVDTGRKSLEECFLGHKESPLECRDKAQAFLDAVAGVETTFVQSIN